MAVYELQIFDGIGSVIHIHSLKLLALHAFEHFTNATNNMLLPWKY
jgi:hypothetical protein